MSAGDLEVRPIIGLEIHVQLATRSKMFCRCPVEFGAEPNTRVCPVCLGLPGALPVINRKAYEYAVLVGLALNCRIAPVCQWDRKSYYYPDLPKNYQISQYDLPLASEGFFELPGNEANAPRRIRIRRAHLEEDAGKSLHDRPGYTGVDLNRAGTPLLEIVTEPDLRSAEETCILAGELHKLVTYLGVSEGNMQKGQMRFEPNVNLALTQRGAEYRTPITEIKNLNSFRALGQAIAYELDHQLTEWKKDRHYVLSEVGKVNCGWRDELGRTEVQRVKEELHDYRYFPDPDLVPVTTEEAWLEQMRGRLPELPLPRRARFHREHGRGDHRGRSGYRRSIRECARPRRGGRDPGQAVHQLLVQTCQRGPRDHRGVGHRVGPAGRLEQNHGRGAHQRHRRAGHRRGDANRPTGPRRDRSGRGA